MENWVINKSMNDDIVISSRIRLARNIKGTPFPYKMNEEKGKEVVSQIEDAFYTSKYNEENFTTFHLWKSNETTNRTYLEKHLISLNLLTNSQKSAFVLNKDETVSIMINEEDHIRLQCITGGLNLKDAFDMADRLDNLLEEKLEYAFDEKLGYLTSCPTNLGTGLRASVMIHLPALSMNNEMNQVLNAVTQVGMTIRGLYGEGSEAQGNLYQISNQVTLGLSEEEIQSNLTAVVHQIINQENWSRERFLKSYENELKDKIYRSLGILRSAVLLNTKECLNLLSNVRMGVEMGIIKDVDKSVLNRLIIETGSASLQQNVSHKLTDQEKSLMRALLVKEKLS